MFDWVGLLLKTGYYYGHIIGVMNFEINWRKGRVFTTTWSTFYAIASNAILVMLIGTIVAGKSSYIIPSVMGHMLFEYVRSIETMLKITAVLGTLLNRWRYQSQLMGLARNALRLCLTSPQVIWMFRWRILTKFIIGLVAHLLYVAFLLGIIKRADTRVSLGLGIQFWMCTILHLSMAQHYMVMLCVRAQYHLLNTELRQVVDESKELSYNPTRIEGAFMTRCCSLADQLENIAKLQNHLQSVVTQLYSVYGIQLVPMISDYYISSVVGAYLAYSIVWHGSNNLWYSQRDLIMVYAWIFFIYVDAILNLSIVLQVQDDHRDMIRLLDERTVFASGLGVRLENSFESIQLQLIRNPLTVNVFNLFLVTRDSRWAMLGSIILHSICLVQYDLENLARD